MPDLTPERIAEIRKIRNCVPFINAPVGVDETQRAIDDLLAAAESAVKLRKVLEAAKAARELVELLVYLDPNKSHYGTVGGWGPLFKDLLFKGIQLAVERLPTIDTAIADAEETI